MTAKAIEQLLSEADRAVLLIGEQLAFLKRDWEEGYGAGLKPITKRRRWAAFLRECDFRNPDPFSSVDCITPTIADSLISGFQKHLLAAHLSTPTNQVTEQEAG